MTPAVSDAVAMVTEAGAGSRAYAYASARPIRIFCTSDVPS